MQKQLNIILQLYFKKIILTILLFGSIFIMYKMYSSFFEKVDYVWKKQYQINFIELITLARHKVEDAKFEMEMNCQQVGLIRSSQESGECKRAKEEYQKAVAMYEEVQKKKEEILKPERNVREYYLAVARSARQYPLPLLLFIFSGLVFVVLTYIFVKEMFLKKKNINEV